MKFIGPILLTILLSSCEGISPRHDIPAAAGIIASPLLIPYTLIVMAPEEIRSRRNNGSLPDFNKK